MEPLADFLKENTDWKVAVPTLPGHGDTLSLKGIKYKEWLEHAEEELVKLLRECERVYVIGFSMGGLIAVYLANKYSVDKLVLLSAAARYLNLKQMVKDLKEMAIDLKKGQLAENELFHRYKDKLVKTPISATREFRKVVATVRPLFGNIYIPTFVAQGLVDGIVPPKSARYIFERIPAKKKELYYAPKGKHHICYGEEQEELFNKVFTFLLDDSRVI